MRILVSTEIVITRYAQVGSHLGLVDGSKLCVRLPSKHNHLLDHRPVIDLAPTHSVIRETDKRRASPHQTRPVHRHERDGRSGREEGEKDDDNQEAGGEYVDRKTGSAERPRSEFEDFTLHALDYHEYDDG